MIFLSALLDVCELNHAKDIEKQLNEQFLKDTDVEAHIKLITRKSMSGSMVLNRKLNTSKNKIKLQNKIINRWNIMPL